MASQLPNGRTSCRPDDSNGFRFFRPKIIVLKLTIDFGVAADNVPLNFPDRLACTRQPLSEGSNFRKNKGRMAGYEEGWARRFSYSW
jgi:hypothetical protein